MAAAAFRQSEDRIEVGDASVSVQSDSSPSHKGRSARMATADEIKKLSHRQLCRLTATRYSAAHCTVALQTVTRSPHLSLGDKTGTTHGLHTVR